MKKCLTCMLLLIATALFSANSQQVHALAFSLDAVSAGGVGFFGDDLLAPGAAVPPPPLVLPGAAGLPPGPPPPPPPPVDVDAFSFGRALPAGHFIAAAEFSVTPGSVGAVGTAVAAESALGDAPADIYGSAFLGGNVLLWDGNGIPGPGLFGPMGVPEPGSNTDGWDYGPLFGLPTALGILFSVTPADVAGHPVYGGASAADVFFSPPVVGYSVFPALYSTAAGLGLVPGDDIDALSVIEDGVLGFSAGDTVYYSLSAGSPSLVGLGASPGDILSSTIAGVPSVAFTAPSLGLLGSDDLDALDLLILPIPEPSTMMLMGLGIPLLLQRKRK